MTTEIALDLLLIILLVTTIGYCVVLNRRLTRLRDGQSEFKALVDTLTAATDKAQRSLTELRELTEVGSAELSKNIAAGREVADELSMITETGNALAGRLEARLTGGQPAPSSEPKKAGGPAAEKRTKDKAPEAKSETEKELLSMLRNVR